MHYSQSYPVCVEHYDPYVFPVAILRTSRLVYQEAYAMLYSGNILVLFDLDTSRFGVEKLFESAKRPPLNIVDSKAPMPPATVHIQHKIQSCGFYRTRIIFAAADIDLVCHALFKIRRPWFGGKLIAVLKVPQNGWTSEQLSEYIWKHLRLCPFHEGDQVIDRTGVFETRAEWFAREDSSDAETHGEGDTKEDGEESGGENGHGDAEEDGDEDGE